MPDGARPRVLLTGATGYIASQLLPTFRERYEIRPIDVRDTDRDGNHVTDIRVVDLLNDPDDVIRPLFAGCDAVVHLAYHRGSVATGPSGAGRGYADERPNVDMADRVLRLSLEEGVRRVVIASSNHAADWYAARFAVIHSNIAQSSRICHTEAWRSMQASSHVNWPLGASRGR